MSLKDEILAKVAVIADRVARSEGLEIVDIELLGGGSARLLRVFIDKPGGVNHGDCENVSHQLGTILDIEDVMPGGSYTLEVSSPGIERKLTRARDFERFVGRKAKIVLRQPLDNRRRWEGRLAAFAEDTITLALDSGDSLRIALAQVEKANLKFER